MAKRRAAHFVLTLVIAIRAFTPALALCVGGNGHRAIEPVGAACCHGSTESRIPEGHVFLAPSSAHCTDTPIGMPSALRSPDSSDPRTGLLASPMALASLDHVKDAVRSHATAAVAGDSFWTISPRDSRTTVNRC